MISDKFWSSIEFRLKFEKKRERNLPAKPRQPLAAHQPRPGEIFRDDEELFHSLSLQRGLIERTENFILHFWLLYLVGTKVLRGDWTLQRRLSSFCEKGESQCDDIIFMIRSWRINRSLWEAWAACIIWIPHHHILVSCHFIQNNSL